MKVQIKELALEDLTEDFYQSLPNKIKTTSLNTMRDHLTKRISGGSVTAISFVDGEYAGSTSLIVDYKLDGRKVGHFEDLYVASKYRNQGIGALLTNFIQYTAWDLGCDQILGTAKKGSFAGKIHPRYGGQIAEDGVWWYKDHPRDGISRDLMLSRLNLDDFKPIPQQQIFL